MQQVNIRTNNPNQVVQFDYNNVFYKIHLYTVYCNTNAQGQREYMTIADVAENGELIVAGVRCIHNSFLIPQSYQLSVGNFRWECVNKDYPFYLNFNKTQQLVFYTLEEMKGLK